MTPLHRRALQIYTFGVIFAMMVMDYDWYVLLIGCLGLPFIAEAPSWRQEEDTRPRPEGWRQADEIVLRARELWQVMLRRIFWVVWVIGWLAADRIGALYDAPDARSTARSLTITAAMALVVAGAYLSRTVMSAWVIRKVSAAVAAEGRYPVT